MKERKSHVVPTPHLQPGQFYGEIVKKRFCSDLVLSELRHSTGRRLPEHSHQLAYFCLLVDGDYSESLGRKTVSYKPLTVMFHPPELTHRDEVGMGGGHFFSVEMESRWLQRLREYSTVPDTITPTHGGDLTWLAMRLYREFLEPDTCSPLAVEGLVMAMLTDVTRIRSKDERQMPRWLDQGLDLIREEFRQNLTVSGIAAEVGIHPFHFSRVFQQFKRQTVSEFVNHLRVQFACHEIKATEKGLADIASDAGFSDQSHFTRVFKQVTGITPGVFRNLTKTR
ncbi:MAG: helix-turn-helix domain-containing protein [Pyrinomonadaceae bacterium]